MPALHEGHGCCRRIARTTAGLPGQRGHDLDLRNTGDREDVACPRSGTAAPPACARLVDVPLHHSTTHSRTAGTAYGAESPVGVLSPTLYVEARLEDGARLKIDEGHPQRAVHVVEGTARIGERRIGPGTMAVLRAGADVNVEAEGASRLMLLGGAPLDGDRHIWWNFVSSSKERIERAKDDWRSGRFGKVRGDEKEFIPLPES